MTRKLLSSVVETFNGYGNIRQQRACQEKIELTPINIVYEPSYDEKTPVPCFFTDKIYMAYISYIRHFDKGKECISNHIVKQCYYYENFVAKNDDAMKKHLTICEGITYSFDNDQIITSQDSFKYLGDVSFTSYFDFETTTGDSVFFLTQKYSL